ncbi:MAG: T9SS type A sorting domain-containing protein [Ignavibacteriae bacterium]|nr:T9SS type A sorting domain-containing protein [Ignavibacteriota bacterium]
MKLLFSMLVMVILFQSNNDMVFSQWQQTNGPGGGTVNCFGSNSERLFVGTFSGIYSTTNMGDRWMFMGLPNKFVKTLLVQDSIIMAGTIGHGAFISSDAGSTWSSVDSSLQDEYIYEFCTTDSGIFAATSKSIYLSKNQGDSWNVVFSGTMVQQVMKITSFDNTLFAVVVNLGVLRSTDFGAHWDTIQTLPSSIKSFCNKDTVIFAGGEFGSIYRSTDNGITWTSNSTSMSNCYVNSLEELGGILFAAAVNMNSYGGNIFRSFDDGVTWDTMSIDILGKISQALHRYQNVLYAGTRNQGVYRTSNAGESWENVNVGLTNVGVTFMMTAGRDMWVSDSYSMFSTRNDGFTWFGSIENGEWEENYKAMASVGDDFFIASRYSLFLYSNSYWSIVLKAPIEITSIVVSESELFTTTSEGGMFFSSDYGNTWAETDSGIENREIGYMYLHGNILFAQTDDGLYRTTNQGLLWNKLPDWPFNETATSIVAFENYFFAGTYESGVYVTTDNGETWIPVNNGLTNFNIRSLAQSRTSLFVATGDGIFLSQDSGETWSPINEGLMVNDVTTLLCKNNYLFAGTNYNGVWRRPLSEITSVENNERVGLPNEFLLEQNYPNPFNPVTVISYQLKVKSAVSLKVYDVLGREVATLVDEIQDAGFKSVTWDAMGVLSGVYYYRLQSETFSDSKKLLIIR